MDAIVDLIYKRVQSFVQVNEKKAVNKLKLGELFKIPAHCTYLTGLGFVYTSKEKGEEGYYYYFLDASYNKLFTYYDVD